MLIKPYVYLVHLQQRAGHSDMRELHWLGSVFFRQLRYFDTLWHKINIRATSHKLSGQTYKSAPKPRNWSYHDRRITQTIML